MHYAFIGLGNLGGHLAASLLRKGVALTVHDRDKALAARHLEAGATWAATPADAVGDALPWTAVPGASPLDIEPTDSDGGEEIVFAAVVLAALVALSAAIAPLLLGPPQGPPDVAAYYAAGSLE